MDAGKDLNPSLLNLYSLQILRFVAATSVVVVHAAEGIFGGFLDHLFASILSPLVNLTRACQHIFEKRFSWFYPPANIKFILEVSK